MTMPLAAYQVVIFTACHSITGDLFLNKRLSDFLNDKRETTISMRNVSVARLQDPAKILHRTYTALIPKTAIAIAFEPPQTTVPRPKGLFVPPKDKFDIYALTENLEVRGVIQTSTPLDLKNILASLAHSFIPVTQATVALTQNPHVALHQKAVLLNIEHIRFIGEVRDLKSSVPSKDG